MNRTHERPIRPIRLLFGPALLIVLSIPAVQIPPAFAAEPAKDDGAALLQRADDHVQAMDFNERAGNLPEAVYHGRAAATIYMATGQGRLAGRILQKVSAMLRAIGLRNSAMFEIRRAADVFEREGDSPGLAVSILNLALLKACGPNPAEGTADYLKALDMAISKALRGPRRAILESAGEMIQRFKDAKSHEKAFAFMDQIASRCMGSDLEPFAERMILTWYEIAMEAKKPDDAAAALDRLLALSKARGYGFGEAEAMKFKGLLLLDSSDSNKRDRLLAACGLFEEETGLRTRIDDGVGLGWALNNLGYALMLSGENSRAAGELARGEAIFSGLSSREGLSKIYFNMKDLAGKTGDKALLEKAEKGLAGLSALKPPQQEEVAFEPANKRLAYYMFLRAGDEMPVIELRMEKDCIVFRDVATGESFKPVLLRPGPVRVTVSCPSPIKWFQESPSAVAKSVFWIVNRRGVKYGDTAVFLGPGDSAYSLRENRLVIAKSGRLPSAEEKDVSGRWTVSGAYPDLTNPLNALATMVESLNRGSSKGDDGRGKVVAESWKTFMDSLSGFIRQEMDEDSFLGTAEKRTEVPLKIKALNVYEIKPFWVRIVYEYVADADRTKLEPQKAAEMLEKQGLGGVFTAYSVFEGSDWKVDFLAGKD